MSVFELKGKLLKDLMGLKIAIIAPHNDDEIIGCWHFLEALSGHTEIDIIIATHHSDCCSLTKKRREETRLALSPIAINQIIYWDFPDGEVSNHLSKLSENISGLLYSYDMILSPAPNDETPDHVPIAKVAFEVVNHQKLLWYRSTWWTFKASSADYIIAGRSVRKIRQLRLFKTQKNIALHRSVILSCFENFHINYSFKSMEAFVFANNRMIKKKAFNSISIRQIMKSILPL